MLLGPEEAQAALLQSERVWQDLDPIGQEEALRQLREGEDLDTVIELCAEWLSEE